jgi:hypothetical protein
MRKWAISFVLFLGIWGGATPLKAELQEVDNDQLKEVTAQDGISISLDHVTFYDEYARINIFDSDNSGSLSLEDVVVGNGNGWGYSFSTIKPLTIDLVEYDAPFRNRLWPLFPTYGEENVILSIDAPAWDQDLYFTVNSLSFCNQALGKLELGNIDLKSFNFMLTTPDYDSGVTSVYNKDQSGIYYRYLFQETVDKLQFTYNTASQGSLLFSGIRFANSFSNNISRYPRVATTDSNIQGYFIIGKSETQDVNEDFAHINLTKSGTSLILDTTLPMEGSIRLNSVQFGARAMGPVAIDGIKVHNMSVQFIP